MNLVDSADGMAIFYDAIGTQQSIYQRRLLDLSLEKLAVCTSVPKLVHSLTSKFRELHKKCVLILGCLFYWAISSAKKVLNSRQTLIESAWPRRCGVGPRYFWLE